MVERGYKININIENDKDYGLWAFRTFKTTPKTPENLRR